MTNRKKSSPKKVSIYSTPTCVYCNMMKDFLNNRNIQYEEYDVAVDLAKREEMVEKSGQMGVPVAVIGQEVLVGFNRERMSQLLGV